MIKDGYWNWRDKKEWPTSRLFTDQLAIKINALTVNAYASSLRCHLQACRNLYHYNSIKKIEIQLFSFFFCKKTATGRLGGIYGWVWV
jgi:hypothetical protein